MKTVLAEKPSVARELARVMGATKKGDGYIEGNGYFFTWAFGHLVELAQPTAYGYNANGWDLASLPMLPRDFKLVLHEDPGAKKQLKVIKECFQRSDGIIVATDAGREGELIFRYIYSFLSVERPFKRLWLSSQTESAIVEGFRKLKDGREYDRLYASAKLRSESDWLVGMNATQALSLTIGNKSLYSIGRVQTPTLVMICKRFLENTGFKPVTYYQLELAAEKSVSVFKAISLKKWETEGGALQALANVRKHASALVTTVETKEKKEPVPLLYDLSSLQQDANRWYGYSADETLGIAQSLYESKYITYPRTGSRYIGEDVFASVGALIKQYRGDPKYTVAVSFLMGAQLNKRSVDAAKVTDHHALLPTEIVPVSLGEKERNVYYMVVERMLESFHQACIKEIVNVSLVASEIFTSSGSVVKYKGWRSVADRIEEGDGEVEQGQLPVLREGDNVKVKEVKNVRKQTKPKPLHTEASLLKAMETCGHEIEDEGARESMKDSGLGTPATRAETIEKLLCRGYIERKKKNLVATPKGLSVYQLVKDKMIGMPELTGQWEKKLSMVEKGEMQDSAFSLQIAQYTRDITGEFMGSGKEIKEALLVVESENMPLCPKCRNAKVKHIDNPKLYAWACNDKEGCGFILFGEIAGKKLSPPQANLLLEQKSTKLIKGFKSKAGKSFDAVLVMDSEHKVKFDFGK